jgi:hypothetical protein
MRKVSSESDFAATDHEARRIQWYEAMWLMTFGGQKTSDRCLVNHIARVCVTVS